MEEWLENNNRYLEASLQWLRLRLQRLIPDVVPALVNALPDSLSTERRRWFSRRNDAGPASRENPRLLMPGTAASREELVRQATAERDEAAKVEPLPALLLLANAFDLSAFERDTAFLCAAQEFDPGIAILCAEAQGSPNRTYPTFSLALALFDEPRWDSISAHRPLRRARLLEISQPGAMPLTLSALRADERVVNFLKGLNILDDRLGALVQPLPFDDDSALSESQREVADATFQRLGTFATESSLPIVQLLGTDAGSRVAVAREVCAQAGRQLYSLAPEALPAQLSEMETLVRLWQRECLLLPVALYIEADDWDSSPNEINNTLGAFLSRNVGLVFLGVRETPLRIRSANFSVDVGLPTAREQCEAWTNILEDLAPELEGSRIAEELAGQFKLNLRDIQSAAESAVATYNQQEPIESKLWRTCRELMRPRMDSLAQRLDPKATWDDLVLPPEQTALLHQIVGQVRERHKVYDQWGFAKMMNRGFGITALFAGESGTGKTMAAEVIANDLQLNLYRIDLSAVVNKYIGETEKNLRRVFDAAERGGAILFFDEADALFGKRSEVKDSHDRYANIEINYLLQRMEAFSGLAILATNMKSALDPAFMRRLRFIINLPYPGIKERQLIWEKALPPQTPAKDLDYERLARLNISGGNIHSIALSAAFIAARNGQTVTMPILLSAARVELRKLDKTFSEGEFRWSDVGRVS